MGNRLEGKVAIVTGAGRGIGRGVALLMAEEGAKVVVNDYGVAVDGTQPTSGPAQEVADEIKAQGGQAVPNFDTVATMEGGENIIKTALDAFGRLDILVNVAGILRDRMIFNMSEEEWDAVIAVHLKGHFAPTHHAANYWRQQSKEGNPINGRVINTSSPSGVFGNVGQTNYGAAKAGIAAFTTICAQELVRYGVRSNCIAPAARTRLTEATPGLDVVVQPPEDPDRFDVWDPANVAPLAGYLATADCPVNGKVFFLQGGKIQLFHPWTLTETIEREECWTVADLEREMKTLVGD